MFLLNEVLLGRIVLIAHEDPFRRRYLAEVLAHRGVVVVAALAGAAEGLALLDADPPPWALLLSATLPNEGATTMSQAARIRRIVTVVVGSWRGGPARAADCDRALSEHCAGFEVVEALSELAARRASPSAGPSGPRRRGH